SEAQLARGQKTPVAGDDPGIRIHQDWIIKPEFYDAGSNLSHLFSRVRPRVLRVRHQPFNRPDLDALRHRGRDLSGAHLMGSETISEPLAARHPAHRLAVRPRVAIPRIDIAP